MFKSLRLLCLLLVIVLNSNSSFAQYFLGMGGSSFSGTNAVYYNPALIADSRALVDVNLLTLGFFASNNHLTLEKGQVVENFREQPRNAYVNLDVRGPSFIYTFAQKNAIQQIARFSIGVDTRLRVGVSAVNVNKNTARLAYNGIKTEELQGITYVDASFNFGMAVWRETGFTFASTINLTPQYVVHVGAHVKNLSSYGGMYVRSERANFKALNKDSLEISLKGNYGYSDDNFGGGFLYDDFSGGFGSDGKTGPSDLKTVGKGTGFDFGIVFEDRKDIYRMSYQNRLRQTENKYRYRAGIAFIDIGKITFNSDRTKTYIYEGETIFTRKEIDSVDGANFWDYLAERKLDKLEEGNSFSLSLPTHFNLHLDYRISPVVYLNMNFLGNLRNSLGTGMSQANYLTFTPRYETKRFEIAAPMSIKNYTESMLGFYIRVSFFSLGLDNISDLLFNDIDTANIYFGFRVPIHRKFGS